MPSQAALGLEAGLASEDVLQTVDGCGLDAVLAGHALSSRASVWTPCGGAELVYAMCTLACEPILGGCLSSCHSPVQSLGCLLARHQNRSLVITSDLPACVTTLVIALGADQNAESNPKAAHVDPASCYMQHQEPGMIAGVIRDLMAGFAIMLCVGCGRRGSDCLGAPALPLYPQILTMHHHPTHPTKTAC